MTINFTGSDKEVEKMYKWLHYPHCTDEGKNYEINRKFTDDQWYLNISISSTDVWIVTAVTNPFLSFL